jgi:hypothetical protein
VNRRHAALAALAGLTIPVLALTTAMAAGSGFVEVVSDPGSAALHLMPGSDLTTEVLVHNESDESASLRVDARNVTDDDDGCVRPEVIAHDTTCGAGGGELGHWLELRVLSVGGSAGDEQLWAGSLSDLEKGVSLLADVGAGDAPRLRLVARLPLAASNETMSDRVSYDLSWTYTGIAGPTETTVLGVQQGTDGGSPNPSLGTLAATGTSVSLGMLGLVAGLLAVGGILAVHGRRRTTSTAEADPSTP